LKKLINLNLFGIIILIIILVIVFVIVISHT
jgi:hypothetical protein